MSEPARKRERAPIPRTPAEEVAYHAGMASFMLDRGFPGLAMSHWIAVLDTAEGVTLESVRGK